MWSRRRCVWLLTVTRQLPYVSGRVERDDSRLTSPHMMRSMRWRSPVIVHLYWLAAVRVYLTQAQCTKRIYLVTFVKHTCLWHHRRASRNSCCHMHKGCVTLSGRLPYQVCCDPGTGESIYLVREGNGSDCWQGLSSESSGGVKLAS